VAQRPGEGAQQAAQAAQGDAQIMQGFLAVLLGGAAQGVHQISVVHQNEPAQGVPRGVGGADQHKVLARPADQDQWHGHHFVPKIRLHRALSILCVKGAVVRFTRSSWALRATG
jgi:hypothetical protein